MNESSRKPSLAVTESEGAAVPPRRRPCRRRPHRLLLHRRRQAQLRARAEAPQPWSPLESSARSCSACRARTFSLPKTKALPPEHHPSRWRSRTSWTTRQKPMLQRKRARTTSRASKDKTLAVSRRRVDRQRQSWLRRSSRTASSRSVARQRQNRSHRSSRTASS